MPFLFLRIARFAGAGLLLLSLLLPWFRVPIGVKERIDAKTTVVNYVAVTREAESTPIFKLVVLVTFLAAIWIGYWRRRSDPFGWATPMAVSGCILFGVILIGYPAVTIQRCAAISAHAAWLQMQHDSLIWLGGDAFSIQEYANQPGEPDVDVKDLPRAFVVLPTPPSAVSELRLAKLPEILMWLGFSPAFCQFAGRGWFSGLFGSFVFAISFVRRKDREGVRLANFGLARHVLVLVASTMVFLVAFFIFPVVQAGRELNLARNDAVHGRCAAALHHLDSAEQWLPVLACQTDEIYQRGWLDRKLTIDSPEAKLVSAIREEVEGFPSRAAEHYSNLLDPETPPTVRGEAFRGALRLAIIDFNSGLLNSASSRLEHLTAIDPSSLKANYALQLADLRTSQKDRLERNVGEFAAVYHCFQSREKRAVLATAHRHLAELYFDRADKSRLGDEMRAAAQP
jgi:hypothetical protein